MYQKKIDEMFGFLKELLERQTMMLKEIISNCFPEQETYLNSEEAAALVQRSVRTLSNWTRKGIIVKDKIGGENYYLESQLRKKMPGKGRK